MNAITVTNLGKAYKQYPTRWSRLFEWLDPRRKSRHSLRWILSNINFEVRQGEAIGVIGVNGAGKSTLLKMITGTTQPTTGNVQVNGRVAALLELGMGFHPDFTGRQNAHMAAQLAGFTDDEITALMPAIEAFADVGEYFDQPVRIYSSGMQARVAFSVAATATPDILIIDEALSVGDMAFQAKCQERMRVLLDQGTTVLLVSHVLNDIRQFCSKAIYLAEGLVRAWGEADKVCDLYQNDLTGASSLQKKLSPALEAESHAPSPPDWQRDPQLRKYSVGGEAGGTLDLEFLNFRIVDAHDKPVIACRSGDVLSFRAAIVANADVPTGAAVGLLIADKTGYHLMACNTNYYDKYLPPLKMGDRVQVEWKIKIPFASGEFRVDTGIKPDPFSSVFYDRVFCVSFFNVVPDVELMKRNFGGYLFSDAEISISVND